MAGPEDGDDASMRTRLKDLSSALEEHRNAPGASPEAGGMAGPGGVGQAVSLGFRVMSEFVASVVVGAVIGWAIDHWLHSSPAALIVFIALGTAAGFWNVYRMASGTSGSPGARR
jgi:ATP synthase protein I